LRNNKACRLQRAGCSLQPEASGSAAWSTKEWGANPGDLVSSPDAGLDGIRMAGPIATGVGELRAAGSGLDGIRMGARRFRDLQVWQRSMELACEAYKMTTCFPPSEVFGLTSQIRGCAVSVPSNIAEGRGRLTDKGFAVFLARQGARSMSWRRRSSLHPSSALWSRLMRSRFSTKRLRLAACCRACSKP
jgi:hypothetical protein